MVHLFSTAFQSFPEECFLLHISRHSITHTCSCFRSVRTHLRHSSQIEWKNPTQTQESGPRFPSTHIRLPLISKITLFSDCTISSVPSRHPCGLFRNFLRSVIKEKWLISPWPPTSASIPQHPVWFAEPSEGVWSWWPGLLFDSHNLSSRPPTRTFSSYT